MRFSQLPHDRFSDEVLELAGCYRFCWTTRSNVSHVVWSEPKTDKLVLECFVSVFRYGSGMAGDGSALVHSLQQVRTQEGAFVSIIVLCMKIST